MNRANSINNLAFCLRLMVPFEAHLCISVVLCIGTWSPAFCSKSWRRAKKEPSFYYNTSHMSSHIKMWVKRPIFFWVSFLIFSYMITIALISEGAAVQEHRYKGEREFGIDRNQLCFTTCHAYYHSALTDVGGIASFFASQPNCLFWFFRSIHIVYFSVPRMDTTSSADYQQTPLKASFVSSLSTTWE